MPNYMITQLDTIEPIPCPCGFARRAFTGNEVASLHLVDISVDSQVHYHKKLTEIYLVIEGEGHIELDGEMFAVKPMTAIFIKPGCRHRAVGNLRVVNIPVPAFDSADEWIDEETVAAGDRGTHLGKADQGSAVSGAAIVGLDDSALDTADGRSYS